MRTIILMSLMLILAISMVQAYEQNLSYSTVGSTASVDAIVSKYEPHPVEPGEKFKIYITVKNIGTEEALQATCRIINNYPFYAYNYNEKSIGSLVAGGEFLINFDIGVDRNAIESMENLEIQCTANPLSGFWITKKIPITIQYRYAILNILDFSTDPEILQIGKEGSIKFKLVNNAESTIKDVLLELNFKDAKIAPAEGSTIKKIRNLNQNEGADINFKVNVLPDTEPGFYTVPLDIDYANSQGEKQNFSTLITIKISETPHYYIIVDSIGPEEYNGGDKIVLKFVNDGKADLKFFNVKIPDSKYLSVKANNEIYIGDLDSDDDITENFYGDLKKSRMSIPLEINYRDALNKEYKEYVNVSVDQSKIMISSQSSYKGLIFVIIVGGVSFYYFYWRKRRK